MKEHLSAIIIATAILLAAAVFACSTRYVHTGQGRVLDKWTGTIKRP